jgi:betaine-aldehyde dehydrogenase
MVTTAKEPATYQLYIDGRWLDSSDGRAFDVVNPATEEVIGRAPEGSRQDMQRAIAAARRAFDEGPWPRMVPRDRARIIRQIADALEAGKDRLRELITAEAGSTQSMMATQVDQPISFLYHYAELAEKLDFEETLPLFIEQGITGPQPVHSQAVHQPAGVVGAITTWNFPLYVLTQKLGPALAAGCTLVVKPPPFAPLVHLEVAKLIEGAGLPEGVLNIVTGSGAEIGEELVASPMVDKISFTGSVPTGKKIAEAAARNLTRVHLELGGKSACIVLDDADLDANIAVMASPAFAHAGQACAITSRCLLPAKLYDQGIEKIAGFVGIIKVGNPADPGVLLGPLIREERRTAVEAFIQSGRDEGAKLVAGGGRPAHLDRGYFLQPTVFADVRNDMRIGREEIFGPVLSVMPYNDIDEAVAVANDSRFGLSGRVITSNLPRGLDVAKRLRTGSVMVSEGVRAPGAGAFVVAPFGGFKESGIGREGGKFGVMEFTETQSILW